MNPATNKIYVSNAGAGAMTVIDGTTNATATISPASGPEQSMRISRQ